MIDPDFQPWPKIPRLKGRVVVTEKIDGTNGQVAIFGPFPDDKPACFTPDPKIIAEVKLDGFLYFVYAGSRNQYVTPDQDNFGFAGWVQRNAEELVATLGPGRHYGEWWGNGIQRGYDQANKKFSLFNVLRWNDEKNPLVSDILNTVPLLFDGENPSIDDIMQDLLDSGSWAAPGFFNPEGIIYYHCGSKDRGLFKYTYEHDKGKWTQDEAA